MTDEQKQTEAQENDAVASPHERVVLRQYTQGAMEDGAAILCNGNMMTIDEIVKRLNELEADANRYRYIKNNQVWRRTGTLTDEDSHAIVGCKFPYLANFEAKSMLDYNIDKLLAE